MLIKNNTTPGYELTEFESQFILSFYPTDLSAKSDNRLIPYNNLEKVFYYRKELFLNDIRVTIQLAADTSLCNYIPNYQIKDTDGTIIALSTLYKCKSIYDCFGLDEIMLSISSICHAAGMIAKLNNSASFSLDDVLIESSSPGAIHIMYITTSYKRSSLGYSLAKFILFKVTNTKILPCDLITFNALLSRQHLHPKKENILNELISQLVNAKSATDWDQCSALASQFANMTAQPYFSLLPQINSKNINKTLINSIQKAFTNSDIIALYPCNDISRNTAINCKSDYFVHVGYIDCTESIRSGIESVAISNSSGDSTFFHQLKIINDICQENTLLIFNNFSEDDPYFEQIAQLSAKIILLTNDKLTDYGITSLYISEE